MQGHAGANLMPLVAANRIGREQGAADRAITFYGSSFIADRTGDKVAEAGRDDETVLTATFDLDATRTDAQRVGPVPRSPPGPLPARSSRSTARAATAT